MIDKDYMEGNDFVGMTVGDVLCIPSLEECTITAGKKGLDRTISSINSYDAPDVINWLKRGDLVLTTGYVFKNDEEILDKLIREMAKRECAGLGIKINSHLESLPDTMLQTANDCHVPLIKIPYHLSLSDMIITIFREMFAQQDLHEEQNRKKSFFTKLLQGDLYGRDAILAEGRSYGLYPGQHICVCIKTMPDSDETTRGSIHDLIDSMNEESGIHFITMEQEDLTILIQTGKAEDEQQINEQAHQFVQSLRVKTGDMFPHLTLSAGIGTYQTDVLGICDSYRKAQKALNFGGKQGKFVDDDKIYHFRSLEAYAVLEHIPKSVLSKFLSNKLGLLMQYDEKNHSDLLKTLGFYLFSFGRTADTARLLGVHRNTVSLRLSKIKELLELDLENGEVVFQLQLALHFLQILD